MPTTTYTNCHACCGAVDTGCCANDLPAVLYGTITNAQCTLLNGGPHTLTYNAGSSTWEGQFTSGGHTVLLFFGCAGAQTIDSDFQFTAYCDDLLGQIFSIDPRAWGTAACSPPSWTKTGATVLPTTQPCCTTPGQTLDATVTA